MMKLLHIVDAFRLLGVACPCIPVIFLHCSASVPTLRQPICFAIAPHTTSGLRILTQRRPFGYIFAENPYFGYAFAGKPYTSRPAWKS